MSRTTTNPDRLAELEEERRFLLQSLRDLDREYEFGDVDEHDYRTLRDDYTVRAARVLRQIEEGRAAMPQRGRRHWGRTIAVAVVVLATGIGLGVVVAQSSGQRLPGQEITGFSPGGGTAAALAEARQAMATDPQGAADLYRMVLDEDSDHPEALAYSGWLTALIGSRSDNEELRAAALESSRELLTRSMDVDPTYADPHCLLAVVAANFEDDHETGREHGAECLELDPPNEMRGLVVEFVDGLGDEMDDGETDEGDGDAPDAGTGSDE